MIAIAIALVSYIFNFYNIISGMVPNADIEWDGILVEMPQCIFLNDSIFHFFLLLRLPSLSYWISLLLVYRAKRTLITIRLQFYPFFILSLWIVNCNLVNVVSQVHTMFGYDSIVSVQICILYMLCEQTKSALFHRYSIFMHLLFPIPLIAPSYTRFSVLSSFLRRFISVFGYK